MDMLLAYARAFSVLQAVLVDAEHRLAKLEPGGGVMDTEQFYIRAELNTIRPHCETLQLEVSLRKVERLRIGLNPYLQRGPNPFPAPTASDLRAKLRDLRETIDDELRTRLFLFVTAANAAMYDQMDLFGTEVSSKFGAASFHIREAGTCLALGRATASVFHLMCVLEVGLDSLAYALAIPYSMKNWEQILQVIEAAISAIGPSSGPDWKQDKEFYGRAALEFRFFRDAWRNHTIHGRAKYTEGEAGMILEHAKAFMQHLATRLQERSGGGSP